MNKKIFLCNIEALKESYSEKYGVSAILIFNKGLTYEELQQICDEKCFYLSNNDLQAKIDKAIEYISHEWFKREQIGISELSFSYTELQHILDILRGNNE